jgi:hypothetical protein
MRSASCMQFALVANTDDAGAGSLRQAILDAADGATFTSTRQSLDRPLSFPPASS